MSRAYSDSIRIECLAKLRELQKGLPAFVAEYFRGVADTIMPRTKVAYALDLRLFFNFLHQEVDEFMDIGVKDVAIGDMENVTLDVLERFMEYLSYYVINDENNGEVTTRSYINEERGKSRKLSAVRSMFSYFYKKQKLSKNVTELLDMPKIREKNIITLEVHEISKMLDEVESGGKLSERQQKFHAYTKTRDLALVTLLLGTGMRVSELVGLDINDFDFEQNAVKIIRKGGKESILYFGREVAAALLPYVIERGGETPLEGHEKAFFLSLHRKRITVRAVQNLVKKYALTVTTLKNISPHKLRSTFGTQLYRETGDIYLVADVLGHTDVNTTKKHYARIDQDRRRIAADAVKLRKD